ncbi:MAG: SsrA-binding protein SmpB, partial [Firmicutes bacterium]|nr:SsrA-binding protein SmpB [Bacillota bacterium]
MNRRSAARPGGEGRVSVARNPRASHDFHFLETFEAGIQLRGTEVKSLRAGKASLKGAWGQVRQGEVWLEGMHITPYEQGNRWNHDPVRSRKLLLHRREIARLIGAVEREGRTLVPVEVYFVRGKAKVRLALATGKHARDSREELKR